MNFTINLHECLDGIMESDYLVDCLPEEVEVDIDYKVYPGQPEILYPNDKAQPYKAPTVEFQQTPHETAVTVARNVESLIPHTVAYTGDIFKLTRNISEYVEWKMSEEWGLKVLGYESECHE